LSINKKKASEKNESVLMSFSSKPSHQTSAYRAAFPGFYLAFVYERDWRRGCSMEWRRPRERKMDQQETAPQLNGHLARDHFFFIFLCIVTWPFSSQTLARGQNTHAREF